MHEYTYWAKRVTFADLKTRNFFADVNPKVTSDFRQMQFSTVALANFTPDTFWGKEHKITP